MISADELVALQAENESLLEFLYLCPVGLMQIDGTGRIELANPLSAQVLLPIAKTPVIENLFELLEASAPDLRNLVAGFAESRGTIFENRRIVVDQTDAMRPHVLACSVIKIDDARFMAVVSDISAQVAQERRLKQADAWFSAIMTGVNDFALLSLDATGRINGWNESAVRQTGFAEREVMGRTLNLFYEPEDAVEGRALEQIEHARRDGWHIDEGWRRRRDGTRFWCQSLVSALEEERGDVIGFSVVLRDVTESKVSGDELRRLLVTDHLTGVANRARFFELGEAEEARWRRFNRPLSALMLDADHFKRINDTHGHAVGDTVLKKLAAACQNVLRTTDVIGRLGGEEFGVLLPGLDLDAAQTVGERLRSAVERLHVRGEGFDVTFTVSVGCASMGGPVDNVGKLLQAADHALYAAKRGGRNRVALPAPAAKPNEAA
ncbi:sensor domain-containing diguanylate cyclase [Salinarimonas soli]|uniref:diguanylate cyclase n=1 Tax=Salinarimonas soli TaxID=1638099 RepID=A0A5B2VHD2_9HYPH|nr:diguanylate cyclase [Salinarimonas soli]KAA2237946.1 diguanylate cyclase [Salinarimonas soli]